MHTPTKARADAKGLRIGVAVSRYHETITSRLRDGAVEQFTAAGGAADDLCVVDAPGTFELTALCRALCQRQDVDAVVALGCVIAGQTKHDTYLAGAVANGLTMITVNTGVPVSFGVLTCETAAQAEARAGGERGNKGAEAMIAAIEAARAVEALTPAKGR